MMMFLNSVCFFFHKDIIDEFNRLYTIKRYVIDSLFEDDSFFNDLECIIDNNLKRQISDYYTSTKELFRDHTSGKFTYKEKKFIVNNIDYITGLYSLYCINKKESQIFSKLLEDCPNAISLYCKDHFLSPRNLSQKRKYLLLISNDLRHQELCLVAQLKYKQLKSYVTHWATIPDLDIKYFSLFYYYPTTCGWEASNAEWNVRKIIWNFKASPTKPKSVSNIMRDHQTSVNIIIPHLLKLFTNTFSSHLSNLTFVCVPSSKKNVNELRYKNFSQELCKKTCMDNAYNFVNITSDGEAKHLGGHVSSKYLLDKNYFNGRYVVLFDDVITTGRSIKTFKADLEKVGAFVICAVSIGKTMHERQTSNPIEIFYI